jgi:hypothetical protein
MFGLLRSLFRRDPRRELVAGLYARVAGAARQRALYADLGVPDTVEGRFEALSVHMVLALRALRHKPDPAGDVARDLTDAFFRDLDASLREMGVGDTAVPKRMKTLARPSTAAPGSTIPPSTPATRRRSPPPSAGTCAARTPRRRGSRAMRCPPTGR